MLGFEITGAGFHGPDAHASASPDAHVSASPDAHESASPDAHERASPMRMRGLVQAPVPAPLRSLTRTST